MRFLATRTGRFTRTSLTRSGRGRLHVRQDPGRAGLAFGGFAELPGKKEQPGPAAPFAFLNGE